MKVRKSFETVQDLKDNINAYEGGRVRINDSGTADWYSVEYSMTEVMMDKPGGCKVTFRKLI
jgi:hypothetical protein